MPEDAFMDIGLKAARKSALRLRNQRIRVIQGGCALIGAKVMTDQELTIEQLNLIQLALELAKRTAALDVS